MKLNACQAFAEVSASPPRPENVSSWSPVISCSKPNPELVMLSSPYQLKNMKISSRTAEIPAIIVPRPILVSKTSSSSV